MRTRSLRLTGVLALIGLAAGCSDTPTQPQPADDHSSLAIAFEEMAAEANREGDAQGAAAFSAGSLALRLGIQPSVIAVVIDGETIEHHALVTSVAQAGGVVSTLIAWTGGAGLRSVLEVGVLGEEGSFDIADIAAPGGRAYGVYRNAAVHQRWFATTGSARIIGEGTDVECPRPLADHRSIRCVEAGFIVEVDGLFYGRARGTTQSDDAVAHRIFTSADGVNGVIVGPAAP